MLTIVYLTLVVLTSLNVTSSSARGGLMPHLKLTKEPRDWINLDSNSYCSLYPACQAYFRCLGQTFGSTGSNPPNITYHWYYHPLDDNESDTSSMVPIDQGNQNYRFTTGSTTLVLLRHVDNRRHYCVIRLANQRLMSRGARYLTTGLQLTNQSVPAFTQSQRVISLGADKTGLIVINWPEVLFQWSITRPPRIAQILNGTPATGHQIIGSSLIAMQPSEALEYWCTVIWSPWFLKESHQRAVVIEVIRGPPSLPLPKARGPPTLIQMLPPPIPQTRSLVEGQSLQLYCVLSWFDHSRIALWNHSSWNPGKARNRIPYHIRPRRGGKLLNFTTVLPTDSGSISCSTMSGLISNVVHLRILPPGQTSTSRVITSEPLQSLTISCEAPNEWTMNMVALTLTRVAMNLTDPNKSISKNGTLTIPYFVQPVTYQCRIPNQQNLLANIFHAPSFDDQLIASYSLEFNGSDSFAPVEVILKPSKYYFQIDHSSTSITVQVSRKSSGYIFETECFISTLTAHTRSFFNFSLEKQEVVEQSDDRGVFNLVVETLEESCDVKVVNISVICWDWFSSVKISTSNITFATQNCSQPTQNCSQSTQNCSYTTQNCSYPTQKCSYPTENCSHAEQNCSQAEQNCSYPAQNCSQAEQNCSYPAQNCSQAEQNFSYPAQNCSKAEQNCSYPAQNCSQAEQNCSYPAQNCSQAEQNRSQAEQNCSYPAQNCSQAEQNCSYPAQNCSQAEQNCSQPTFISIEEKLTSIFKKSDKELLTTGILKDLRDNSANSSNLSQNSIISIVKTLDRIANLLLSKSSEIPSNHLNYSRDVLSVYQNVYQVNETTLFNSQKSSGTAAKFLASLETLTKSLPLSQSSNVLFNNFISIGRAHFARANGRKSHSYTVFDREWRGFNDSLSHLASLATEKREALLASKDISISVLEEAVLNNSSITFFYLKDDLFFRTQMKVANSSTEKRIISPVISASTKIDEAILRTSRLVEITFSDSIIDGKGNASVRCVFWNTATKSWSAEGCTTLLQSSLNRTSCRCDHLTSFALILQMPNSKSVTDPANLEALKWITYVSLTLSCLCLLATIAVYSNFLRITIRNLHGVTNKPVDEVTPARTILSFSVALFLANLVFVAGSQLKDSGVTCKFVGALLHYLYLSVFFWSGIEALRIFLTIIYVNFRKNVLFFRVDKLFLRGSLLAWGMPLLIVVITLGINRTQNYGLSGRGSKLCFIINDLALYVSFVAPLVVILTFDTVVFALILYIILAYKKTSSGSCVQQHVDSAKTAFGLATVLSLTWVLGLLQGIVFEYFFVVLTGFQGVATFTFFCLCKAKVRKLIRDQLSFTSLTSSSGSSNSSRVLKRRATRITDAPMSSSSDGGDNRGFDDVFQSFADAVVSFGEEKDLQKTPVDGDPEPSGELSRQILRKL